MHEGAFQILKQAAEDGVILRFHPQVHELGGVGWHLDEKIPHPQFFVIPVPGGQLLLQTGGVGVGLAVEVDAAGFGLHGRRAGRSQRQHQH